MIPSHSLLAASLMALSCLAFAGCEDEPQPCGNGECCDDSADCCEGADCCVGDECNPQPSHGVAIQWESLASENGPAASGTLLLKLTSGDGVCADPWLSELTCEEGAWEAEIPLPPSAQFVGATISLADLGDLGGATFRRPTSADADCSIESGVLGGTLEVVAINETSVQVRVTGGDPEFEDLALGVSVPRCQNPELPQQAVAMFEGLLSTLYAPKFAGDGEAPAPIQEPLHVFIDQSDPIVGATCADPLALMGGCESPRATLEVVFDTNSQYPGTFELGTSGVTITERTSSAGIDACEGGMTAWDSGSVVILAVTPSLVHVRVTDAEGAVVDAVATHCY